MSDVPAAQNWTMGDFVAVVSQALADSVAAHLRAVEDSVSNIESTRDRMGQALDVWYLWERSRSMGGPEHAALCGVEHDWVEREYLIPGARPNAFTGRQGSDVSVEWCARCGSVQLRPVDAKGTATGQALLILNQRT